MRAIVSAIAAFVATIPQAHAFECRGALTDAQAQGFSALFSPVYSPGLRRLGGAVAPENMKKVLTSNEARALSTPDASTAATSSLTRSQAGVLRSWLNENAQASAPGWVSTAMGMVAPTAWLGLAADVLLQLGNGSGDAGRLHLANIAGSVSEGGEVAVLHRVISDNTAAAYVWIYIYTATLNGQRQVFVLRSCSADVIIR